jgi:general secretion pathway protein D
VKECRLRRLDHVAAVPLITKLRTMLQQLRGVEVAGVVTTAPPTPPSPPMPMIQPIVAPSRPAEPASRPTVYLDADDRANRLLMIGSEQELDQVETLVDALDLPYEDARAARTYDIRNLPARRALEQLRQMDLFKNPGADGLSREPVVTVVEATNQLLARATPDQHARIEEELHYIDAAPGDSRTIAAYELHYIDAGRARSILEELDLVKVGAAFSSPAAGPNQPGTYPETAAWDLHAASVVVNESTNALLVKATAEQQDRIARIVKYIDTTTPANEPTYQMYPLESSSPDHLASLLDRLISETTKSKDGKIERLVRRSDQIGIVPDPNTFSLIVYASPRDQKLIAALIQRLDKRRPQVLIEVTLVEISRTDIFESDLNLVASANSAVAGNVVINPIQNIDSRSRLEAGFNSLDSSGNSTGRTSIFYSDEKVQALLTAIQRKNYGRVLAKPKVLVDDGQAGQITTRDETTYIKESIQIPQTGTPITTRDFVPIEASISLQIVPHISEGSLLRLDTNLSRSDFGTRPLAGGPPDKVTSEVKTTVFIPHDHTVILGGLVRLNQTKGGSKVPLLGDIPLIGILFRSIDNSDVEKKLYVFMKANIVRPYDESKLTDLQELSREHEEAFERSESEFQDLQAIPGIPPKPMEPQKVLGDYR